MIDFILVCQCFTCCIACYRNFKFHVIGVHVNTLRFGVAKIWKSSVFHVAVTTLAITYRISRDHRSWSATDSLSFLTEQVTRLLV